MMRHAFDPEPTPTHRDDQSDRAMTRASLATAIAFVGVLVTSLVLGGMLTAGRFEAADGWYDRVGAIISLPLLMVLGIGASGLAAAVVDDLASRLSYLRGHHRCRCCGRRRWSIHDACCFTPPTDHGSATSLRR